MRSCARRSIGKRSITAMPKSETATGSTMKSALIAWRTAGGCGWAPGTYPASARAAEMVGWKTIDASFGKKVHSP